VEDEPFEGLAAVRDDDQPVRLPSGDERLLDRPASGDELLFGTEETGQIGALDATRVGGSVLPWPRPVRSRVWARRRPSVETRTVGCRAAGSGAAAVETAARGATTAPPAPLTRPGTERGSRPATGASPESRRSRTIETSILGPAWAAFESAAPWAALEPPRALALRGTLETRPVASLGRPLTAGLPRSIAARRAVVAVPLARPAAGPAASAIAVTVEVAFGAVSTAKAEPLTALSIGWPTARWPATGRWATQSRGPSGVRLSRWRPPRTRLRP